MLILFARSWWTVALRGAIAVLLGAMALIWPRATLLALVVMFGAYSFMDRILMIIMLGRGARAHRQWWVWLLKGLVGLGACIVALVWPGMTALLHITAVWAMVTGVLGIAVAILLRKEIRGGWVLITSGLLSVGFGLAMTTWPGAGAQAVTGWIGSYAIVVGVLSILLALKLRGRFKTLHQRVGQGLAGYEVITTWLRPGYD